MNSLIKLTSILFYLLLSFSIYGQDSLESKNENWDFIEEQSCFDDAIIIVFNMQKLEAYFREYSYDKNNDFIILLDIYESQHNDLYGESVGLHYSSYTNLWNFIYEYEECDSSNCWIKNSFSQNQEQQNYLTVIFPINYYYSYNYTDNNVLTKKTNYKNVTVEKYKPIYNSKYSNNNTVLGGYLYRTIETQFHDGIMHGSIIKDPLYKLYLTGIHTERIIDHNFIHDFEGYSKYSYQLGNINFHNNTQCPSTFFLHYNNDNIKYNIKLPIIEHHITKKIMVSTNNPIIGSSQHGSLGYSIINNDLSIYFDYENRSNMPCSLQIKNSYGTLLYKDTLYNNYLNENGYPKTQVIKINIKDWQDGVYIITASNLNTHLVSSFIKGMIPMTLDSIQPNISSSNTYNTEKPKKNVKTKNNTYTRYSTQQIERTSKKLSILINNFNKADFEHKFNQIQSNYFNQNTPCQDYLDIILYALVKFCKKRKKKNFDEKILKLYELFDDYDILANTKESYLYNNILQNAEASLNTSYLFKTTDRNPFSGYLSTVTFPTNKYNKNTEVFWTLDFLINEKNTYKKYDGYNGSYFYFFNYSTKVDRAVWLSDGYKKPTNNIKYIKMDNDCLIIDYPKIYREKLSKKILEYIPNFNKYNNRCQDLILPKLGLMIDNYEKLFLIKPIEF
ncbi:MAG: hypothetical protein H6553_08985 [Chitinophagales bacterium]|nr:hypothetical protein [Chitinophagales bacterium]